MIRIAKTMLCAVQNLERVSVKIGLRAIQLVKTNQLVVKEPVNPGRNVRMGHVSVCMEKIIKSNAEDVQDAGRIALANVKKMDHMAALQNQSKWSQNGQIGAAGQFVLQPVVKDYKKEIGFVMEKNALETLRM